MYYCMPELSTAEKYTIAQILVCGAIDGEEFRTMNNFDGAVQRDTLRGLKRAGVLQHTLYEGDLLEYEEQ